LAKPKKNPGIKISAKFPNEDTLYQDKRGGNQAEPYKRIFTFEKKVVEVSPPASPKEEAQVIVPSNKLNFIVPSNKLNFLVQPVPQEEAK
jgi:hypothetical protein